MKVLVVGKGGREHAFVWKLAQSNKITKLYAAPGNPGMAQHAECVNIEDSDLEGLADFAKKENIDITIIGPEAPLDAGIVDLFESRGLTVFGPTQKAAQIEADKDYALELMHKYNVPTAPYETYTDATVAKNQLKEWQHPLYLKVSGLAAGKGAIHCETLEDSYKTVDEVLVDHKFGSSGDKLVAMGFLDGEEASIFGFTDGKDIVCIVPAQDHKTIDEGDVGLNTGGMGAYAPAPIITPELFEDIVERVMKRTVDALAKEGRPYKGILYGGIIVTKDGPQVIEFNCRMGDPETQAVLSLMKTDLMDVITAVCNGTVADLDIELDTRAATTVVMASGGYPVAHETGFPISGIEAAEALGEVTVFHAGTNVKDGQLVTDGGRVLAINAVGDDIRASIDKAYEAVAKISFKDHYYRRDIGHRVLARLEE
ncbi:MAG: phosphoribosylamine--glycine ligase [Candidatus Latescibacteria bacterium]|jgi:phosphoribosylamine---glycine ligase|nr:phosphoribosylamine--glycine ligase [Candidatus Latescibacterota bacterium]MBT5830760.1 phosphoribosylamine--glycine ligase [Candidatus Latescibacterota bacterium]